MKWNRKPQQAISAADSLSANTAGLAKSWLSLQGQGTRSLRTFIIIFAILAAGIIAAGYFYYNNYESQFRRQVEAQLKSIADLKVGEIVHWRQERLGDGSVYNLNRSFHALAQRYFNNPADTDVRGQLQEWMRELQLSEDYNGVFLFDTSGSRQLSSLDDSDKSFDYHQEHILETLRSGKVTFLDLNRESKDEPIHLSVIVPIIGEGNNKSPIGVLALRISPESYLYPLIEHWPVPSKSAETTLTRREGSDALFLNTLKFREDAALNVRIPLSRTDVPAVMAVLGTTGLVDGVDYRGVPVIAYVRAVPESPWFIVAKMDKSEIYAPLRDRAFILAAMIGFLLLGAGALVMLVSRQQHTRFYHGLAQSAEALRASEKQLREAQAIGRLGSWEWDVASDTLKGSKEFYRLFDVKPEEIARFSLFISLLHPADRERVQQEIAESISEKRDYSAEYRVRLKDGSWREISARGRVFVGEDGAPLRLTGTCADITERRKAEQALGNEAIRRRILVGGSRDGIVVLDVDGKVVEANRKYAEMLGYTLEEVMKLSVWDWDRSFSHDVLLGLLRDVDEAGDQFETRHTRKDGTQYDVEISSNAAVIDGRKLIFCVCRDITGRKQAEERLRKLLRAVEQSPSAVVITDLRGSIEYVNPKFVEITGYSLEEAIGQNPRILKSGEHPTEFYQELWAAITSGHDWHGEFHNKKKNGELYWEYSSISPVINEVGEVTHYIAVKEDITERKLTEEALRQSERRFVQVAESTGEVIWETDASGLYVYISPASEEVLGYTPDELVGKMHFYDLFAPEVREQLKAATLDDFTRKATFRDFLNPNAKKDGSTVILETSGIPILDEQGNLLGYRGTDLDVTEREQAIEKLRKSEDDIRLILDSATEGIYGNDLQGNCTFVNQAFLRTLGYKSADELLGKHVHTLIHHTRKDGTPYPAEECKIYQAFREGIGTHADDEVFWKADGTSIQVEYWSYPQMKDGKVIGAVATFIDITERKKAEAVLYSVTSHQEALLDAIPDIVMEVDTNLVYTWANDAGIAFFGEDVIGKEATFYYVGEQNTREKVRPIFDGSEETIYVESLQRRADGKERLLAWQCRSLKDAAGEVIGAISSAQDITERKQAEAAVVASEVRYRRLFEAARDGILILDAVTGKIVDINPFLADLLGAPRQELLGQELWEIGSFRDITASKSAFMELQDKGYVRYEDLPLIAADGRRLEVEFISNVYQVNGSKVIQCNIRDITERKQAEAELLKYRDHLEELVEERTREMKEAVSLLGATLESTADGIIVVDTELKITAHNNNFLQLWDAPAALAEAGDSEKLLAFVTEKLADPEAFLARLEALYLTPEADDFDTIYLKDGRIFERLSIPQRMGDKITGRVWSFRDVTGRKLVEAELEESDERYRALISNSTEGVYRIEAIPPIPVDLPEEEQIDLIIGAGVMAECNDAMAKMNGLEKADDLVGATFKQLFARMQESEHDFLHAFISSGYRLADAESAEVDAQGNLHYYLHTVVGIIEGGMLLRAWGNQRDITERKKAEAEIESSRQMMRTVLDAFPGIVFWKDLNLSFLGCNSKLADMAGLASPADIVGRPDRDFPWSSQSAHYLIDDLQVLNSGEPKLGIIEQLPQLDGGTVWLNTSKVPLRNAQGDIIGLLGTSIDITELKRTEDALEIAKETAENASHAKSTFLANMSHEIRTPMNAVLGYTQILQRDATLSPTQMKYIETIGRSGEFLLRLINDILEMSKIEAGKVTLAPAPFDFCAMLRDTEAMFSQRAEEKNLQLTFACAEEHLQTIVADAMRVRQVITNMLGNAIKFTSAGGISVQVTSSGRDGMNGILVSVEVKDTGMGIPEDELDSVFGSFEQTQRGQMLGGTGLGMAISRQLARLMGGDLTVQSEVDMGSTFTFTFHAVTSPAEEALGATVPVIMQRILGLAHLPGPRILVVDDKDTNRDVLTIMLSQIGFIVRDAANGEAAIAIFNEWHPDAILMDNRMPVMDGLEATKRIKATPEGKSTSIIMVTASAMEDDRQDAIEDGVDGFVRKPYHEGELLSEIGRLLKLEYLYDETREIAPEPHVTEASFAAEASELPAELAASLMEAAEMGDKAGLAGIVNESVIPTWPSLGEHLLNLTQDYNYEQVVKALKPAGELETKVTA